MQANQRINEIDLSVVAKKYIVTVFPDIRYGNHSIAEEIAVLLHQAFITQGIHHLSFGRECLRLYGSLPENNTDFAAYGRYAHKVICTFGEQDVVDHMLVYPVRLTRQLQRPLGLQALDFVEAALAPVPVNLALASALRNQVAECGNPLPVNPQPCGLGGLGQRAYLIARAAIWISASLSLQRRRKQSDTAAIRYGLLALGREPMNSATVIPLSDILSVCIFSGMAFLPEESDYGLNQFHVAIDIISKVARAEEAKAPSA